MLFSSSTHTTRKERKSQLMLTLTSVPAGKGRKAGFFLKLPFPSRKCCGLKESSFSTECNKGMISVSCFDTPGHVGLWGMWNALFEEQCTFGIV